jgi:hypothetical protein
MFEVNAFGPATGFLKWCPRGNGQAMRLGVVGS